jgi:hypothetical protein
VGERVIIVRGPSAFRQIWEKLKQIRSIRARVHEMAGPVMSLLLSVIVLQCLSRAGALRVANPVRTNPAVEEKAGSGLPGTKVSSNAASSRKHVHGCQHHSGMVVCVPPMARQRTVRFALTVSAPPFSTLAARLPSFLRPLIARPHVPSSRLHLLLILLVVLVSRPRPPPLFSAPPSPPPSPYPSLSRTSPRNCHRWQRSGRTTKTSRPSRSSTRGRRTTQHATSRRHGTRSGTATVSQGIGSTAKRRARS